MTFAGTRAALGQTPAHANLIRYTTHREILAKSAPKIQIPRPKRLAPAVAGSSISHLVLKRASVKYAKPLPSPCLSFNLEIWMRNALIHGTPVASSILMKLKSYIAALFSVCLLNCVFYSELSLAAKLPNVCSQILSGNFRGEFRGSHPHESFFDIIGLAMVEGGETTIGMTWVPGGGDDQVTDALQELRYAEQKALSELKESKRLSVSIDFFEMVRQSTTPLMDFLFQLRLVSVAVKSAFEESTCSPVRHIIVYDRATLKRELSSEQLNVDVSMLNKYWARIPVYVRAKFFFF